MLGVDLGNQLFFAMVKSVFAFYDVLPIILVVFAGRESVFSSLSLLYKGASKS